MMDNERNEMYFKEFRDEGCTLRKKSKFYCRLLDGRCDENSMNDCPLFALFKFTARKLQS